MSEGGIENTKKQIKEIEAFKETAAFSSYRATVLEDISICEKVILMTPPTNQENIAAQLIQFGRMDALREQLSIFEDNLDILKKTVQEIEDSALDNE